MLSECQSDYDFQIESWAHTIKLKWNNGTMLDILGINIVELMNRVWRNYNDLECRTWIHSVWPLMNKLVSFLKCLTTYR